MDVAVEKKLNDNDNNDDNKDSKDYQDDEHHEDDEVSKDEGHSLPDFRQSHFHVDNNTNGDPCHIPCLDP